MKPWILFAALAGLLHLAFFAMESVLLGDPQIQARFKLSAAAYEYVRPWAFNQGFYNLFLAGGVLGGLLYRRVREREGTAIVLYACTCMLGAGVVLGASSPELGRAAAVQALPPLLALLLWSRRLEESSESA